MCGSHRPNLKVKGGQVDRIDTLKKGGKCHTFHTLKKGRVRQTEHPKKGAPAQVKGQGALDKNKQRVRRGAGGLLEMRGVSAHPSTREGGGGSALLGRLFLEVFEGFLS